MSTTPITIQAAIHAPDASVWHCYTQPQHITQWNQASPDWHCPSATNDMRIGGRYVARMEARDGSMGFDFEAIYDAIEEGKQFTYTMTDGRRATVQFTPDGM
ncbi:MAG TPA: SRPBCC domain-containing protein, partial [Phnomibacter sp.]|nr:SRPBCC domain-containing protein [Phnomibacter sp.]